MENQDYFIEYFIDNKFFGVVSFVAKDREKFGFFGAKTEVLEKKVVCDNKKVIKAGTTVVTYLQMLQGKKVL